MTEEIEFILDSTEESMIGSAHLEKNSEHSRRKSISCDVRKCFCRLLRLSNTAFAGGKLSVPDARTITLQPFERNMLHPIEKQSWWLTLVLIQ
jgi:ribosome recycling factor